MIEVTQKIHEKHDPWKGFRSHLFKTLMADGDMMHFYYSSDRLEDLGQDKEFIERRLKTLARLIGASHDRKIMKQLRKYMNNIFKLPSGKEYEIKSYREI